MTEDSSKKRRWAWLDVPVVRAVFLVLLGVLTGAVYNACRPEGGLSWRVDDEPRTLRMAREWGIPVVTVEQVAEQIRYAGVVLDARAEADFNRGALPGAFPLSWAEVGTAFREIEPFLLADEPVIVYCSGLACDEALLLCRFLREQGYGQVYLFAGGVEAWRAAGQPLEGGP